MATIVRGSHDDYVDKLKLVLDQDETEYPGSVATLYRQNTASVRIRIVDAHSSFMNFEFNDPIPSSF